jgi:hypothetical protein
VHLLSGTEVCRLQRHDQVVQLSKQLGEGQGNSLEKFEQFLGSPPVLHAGDIYRVE